MAHINFPATSPYVLSVGGTALVKQGNGFAEKVWFDGDGLHRYMQIEGMAELTPPLIDADPATLPPHGGLTDGHLKLHPDLHLLDGRDPETRASNYREAVQYYRQALELNPGNPRLQTRLSLVLAAIGDTAGAERIIRRLQAATADNPVQRNQVDLNRVLAALYRRPPAGFEEAIEVGERLLQTEQAANGYLHLWLASAYGQRLSYRRRSHEAEPIPQDDPDREKALARLRDMVRLRPDLIPLARSLLHPDPGSKEDDLALFSGDPEFEQLLGSGRSAETFCSDLSDPGGVVGRFAGRTVRRVSLSRSGVERCHWPAATSCRKQGQKQARKS